MISAKSYLARLTGLGVRYPFANVMFTLPALFVDDLNWLTEPRGFAVAIHLGVIATALAYALFARGLKLIPVATAVTLSLAEPLTAAILGVVLLGEQLTPLAILGLGLLFVGLALITIHPTRAQSSAALDRIEPENGSP